MSDILTSDTKAIILLCVFFLMRLTVILISNEHLRLCSIE